MLIASVHRRTVHDVAGQGWVVEDPPSKEPLGRGDLEDRDGDLAAANREVVLNCEHSIAVAGLADAIELALPLGGQRVRNRPFDLDAEVWNLEPQRRFRRLSGSNARST